MMKYIPEIVFYVMLAVVVAILTSLLVTTFYTKKECEAMGGVLVNNTCISREVVLMN